MSRIGTRKVKETQKIVFWKYGRKIFWLAVLIRKIFRSTFPENSTRNILFRDRVLKMFRLNAIFWQLKTLTEHCEKKSQYVYYHINYRLRSSNGGSSTTKNCLQLKSFHLRPHYRPLVTTTHLWSTVMDHKRHLQHPPLLLWIMGPKSKSEYTFKIWYSLT